MVELIKKTITDSIETNILTTATQEEVNATLSYFKIDHLRSVCRVFKQKLGSVDSSKAPISLLDVGCRDNKLSNFFQTLGYNYVGIDANPVGGGGILKGKMEDMPFNDESFNIIFSSHTLEHSENQVQALKEMKRVLKLGGVLFLATPMPCDYQIFNCDKTHVLVPTDKQMRRLLEYVGFKVFSVEYWATEGEEDRFTNLISIAMAV